MKKGSLSQLANASGLSKTTISRVINGKGDEYRISKETQEQILRLVRESGYQPDPIARSLRGKSTKTLGLIVPYISNPFFANLSSVIITEAYRQGYSVLLQDTMENPELEDAAMDNLIYRNVDGILAVPCSASPAKLEEVAEDVPLIQVDRYFPDSGLSYISTNNYEGAKMAVSFLIKAGHRNIFCISGPSVSITTQERLRGCRAAIEESGKDIVFASSGNEFSSTNGYVETKLLLSGNDRPTAIFALSNTILLGALEALRENHVKIPEEMSLISFDDNIYMDYLSPSVTRVVQPVSNIGMAAVKLILQSIESKKKPEGHILMSPTIIYRDSVTAPRKA